MSNTPTSALARPFDTPERKAFRESVEGFINREIEPFANDWDEVGLARKSGRVGSVRLRH